MLEQGISCGEFKKRISFVYLLQILALFYSSIQL